MYELVLEGPGKNALSTKMMESILARLDEADGAPVLFSSKTTDVFCAGLDLKEIASLDAAGMARFVDLVETLMVRIYDYPSPTIACVAGHAIAGGCVITLCCDHRVMTSNERARIGLNEVPLGLIFPPKIFRIVSHRVPPRGLHEVVLRGALHASKDALRFGLVDEIADDPHAIAKARASELEALPRRAYNAAKAMLRMNVTTIDPKEYAAALAMTLPAWTSDDIKQRVLAQLKK